MFSITSITTPAGYQSTIFGGLAPNVQGLQPGTRMGPEGSMYFVSVPGLGCLFLEDVGSTPTGWGVRVNGSAIWTYPGEGAGQITVAADGSFTLSGGTGPVSSALITNMKDSGALLQQMYEMVIATPSIQPAWTADPMSTLYGLGFPRTCMYNMDPNCCTQFVAVIKNLPLSGPGVEAGQLGSWLGCASCKVWLAGVVSATAVVLIATIATAIELTGGVGEAALADLEASASVEAISLASRVGAARVARLAAAAFATGGVTMFVSEFIDLLCKENGSC